MTHNPEHTNTHQHGSIKSYVIGFVLSIVLTLISYFLVERHLLTGFHLIGTIIGVGIIQVVVQLFFFLHLGQESKPFWNFQMFVYTVTAIVILVWGTIWIMDNLDYRMMDDMNMSLSEQELKSPLSQ